MYPDMDSLPFHRKNHFSLKVIGTNGPSLDRNTIFLYIALPVILYWGFDQDRAHSRNFYLSSPMEGFKACSVRIDS